MNSDSFFFSSNEVSVERTIRDSHWYSYRSPNDVHQSNATVKSEMVVFEKTINPMLIDKLCGKWQLKHSNCDIILIRDSPNGASNKEGFTIVSTANDIGIKIKHDTIKCHKKRIPFSFFVSHNRMSGHKNEALTIPSKRERVVLHTLIKHNRNLKRWQAAL